ncbi:MAG: hypothetical protein MUF83_19665 [Acidimicrobiales bacterium]|jgi:hypothetical protein|nr:hypothetical protein [Acidimicrobiales bacterium]
MPPTPAKSGNKGCWTAVIIVAVITVLFGVGIVGCIAWVGNEASDLVDETVGPADEADYELSEEITCSEDDLGSVQASGEITNTSNEQRGFLLTIEFTDGSGARTTESVPTGQLEPDETESWQTVFGTDGSDVTCSVDEVSNLNDPFTD